MQGAEIIEPMDAERPSVEAFIRDVYAREHGARIDHFADRLLRRTNIRGETVCVAGLRLAADGFFSERYLAEPIEAALARATGRSVHRDDIYEVTTLTSRSPRDIVGFIDDIVSFGARNGLAWCFFTLTHRLSLLVERLHLAPIYLGEADPARIEDAAAWGRYYTTRPKVYGVCGIKMLKARAPQFVSESHAGLR